MGQQQLVPEPQDESEQLAASGNNEQIYQKPYQSAQAKNGPKHERPSAYEESIPSYSYHAQDSTAHTESPLNPAYNAHAHETDTRARQSRRQRFSGEDGDALENGYRPYQQRQRMYSQMPPRQKKSHIGRWIVLITLGIILIKPILMIIGFLLVAGLSVVALFVLVPLIILATLILAAIILSIPLRRALWPGLRK